MADEASVRMTVDSSQAISENQKYVRAATESFNTLIQKSEQYSGNLKQRVQFMEQEIKLMTERNRLDALGAVHTEKRLYAEGKIAKEEYRGGIAQIREEEAGEKGKLTELVRITKQWTTDQKTSQLKAERLGQDVSRMATGMFSAETAGGMVTGMSTGLLAGSMIGALAAVVIGKEIKGAMQMEPAIRDYALLTGRSQLGMTGAVGALDIGRLGNIGLTPSQYYTGAAQLTRGGVGTVNENLLGIMAAERATGVSRAQTAGLLGIERYGTGQVTPLMSYFEKYLRTITDSITEQKAMLPEILQTFSQEATAMMRVTGKVDTAAVAAAVSVVGKQFGFVGEPLQTVTGALRQGMQQSSMPMVQALQYSAMEKAMPGASLWQMQMAMETPFTNPKYITEFLGSLKSMTGGGEQYARTLFNVFGQYGITANLADQMAKGTITSEQFLTEAEKFQKTGVGGFEPRAAGLTGELEKVTSEWQGFWERSGFVNVEPLVSQVRDILNSIGGVVTIIKDDVAATREKAAEEEEERRRRRAEDISFMERTILILRGLKPPSPY